MKTVNHRSRVFGCLHCGILAAAVLCGSGASELAVAASEPALQASAAQRSAERLREWSAGAVASDPKAIAALRQAGQPGLDALLQFDPPLLAAMRSGEVALDDPKAAALRSAIEKVARQRDAHASGLYWYTDLEKAKAAAAASGKRILSLRLLGNLDEEYSCANSRFFRTVLYANAEVSERLRKNYVLHWQSVRPAPIVTIDMGDGRRIKRTITGNSIHYVLDSDGTVLDALPGLYGPEAFLTALDPLEEPLGGDADLSRKWHAVRADRLCRNWLEEGASVGVAMPVPANSASAYFCCFGSADDLVQKPSKPPAKTAKAAGERRGVISQKEVDEVLARLSDADEQPQRTQHLLTHTTELAPVAAAKSMVERPISRGTLPHPGPAATPAPQPATDSVPLVQRMSDETWRRIAEAHREHLDESSRRLMMAKLPRASVSADERSAGKVIGADTPFARTLKRFEAALSQDTTYNAYVFHAQIHHWLATDESDHLRHDLDGLNKRVYSELFLTPDQDAWLGLVPDDTYTALEKDGCACDPGAPPMQATQKSPE